MHWTTAEAGGLGDKGKTFSQAYPQVLASMNAELWFAARNPSC